MKWRLQRNLRRKYPRDGDRQVGSLYPSCYVYQYVSACFEHSYHCDIYIYIYIYTIGDTVHQRLARKQFYEFIDKRCDWMLSFVFSLAPIGICIGLIATFHSDPILLAVFVILMILVLLGYGIWFGYITSRYHMHLCYISMVNYS